MRSPILLAGAVDKDTVLRLLEFLKSRHGDWAPTAAVIDKSEAERNALRAFANNHDLLLEIRLCLFHIKQAVERWMRKSKNKVPEHLRPLVLTAMSMLHHTLNKTTYNERKAAFLSAMSRQHVGLYLYLQEHWFCQDWEPLWTKCLFRRHRFHSYYTNNYIESWHKLVKAFLLKNKKISSGGLSQLVRRSSVQLQGC